MKKIIIAILISLISLPVFSVGILADTYLGQSSGVDLGVVFGKGKVLTSLGLVSDSHTIADDGSSSHHDDHYSGSNSKYDNDYNDYNNKTSSTKNDILKTKVQVAHDIGPFVRFDWISNFFSLGIIKMGIDVGSQLSFTFNEYSGFNILVSAFPMLNASLGNWNFFAGYKGTLYVADSAIESIITSPYTSAFSFGAIYRFGKGQAQSQGGKGNSNTPITGIDTSSNPTVIVLPSSNSVTQ